MPSQALTLLQKNQGMVPAAMPIHRAPEGSTYPQAGVMSTRPATAPEQNPSTLGLPLTIHSHMGQTNEPTAVAMVVVVKALAAMTSPATALPELNPYHPTHSIEAPMKVITMLCGVKFSLPKPMRLPRMIHSTRPDQPEDICTTVP